MPTKTQDTSIFKIARSNMEKCSNCGQKTLHVDYPTEPDDPGGWFCLGCYAVGIGMQPADLKERPCRMCGIKTFEDLCYSCEKNNET